MSGAALAGPTLGELLAPTGLPALLDQTPAQLLAGLGLDDRLLGGLEIGSGAGRAALGPNAVDSAPPVAEPVHLIAPPGLPELPALPALPAVDPLALLAPVAQLLNTFGSGTLPGGPADPTATLTGLSQVLETGVGAAASAAQALSGLWSGQSGAAAAGKSVLSAANAGALAAQGAAMATDIQGGLAIVGAGLVALQGVIVKTAGLISATLPAIMTPPGQLAALGFAAEGLAEAMAVVAVTRAQLAAPTAKMAVDGAKVPVTPPPVSPDQLSGLVQSALPLVSSGVQLAGTLLTSALAPPSSPPSPGDPLPAGNAPVTPAPGMPPGAPGSGGPGQPGAGQTGTVPAGNGGAPSTPTVRPAGLGALPPAAAAEPSLGQRPVSAEPLPGVTQSPSSTAPGWAAPGSAPAVGPLVPVAPAVAAPAGIRVAAAARGPFDVGEAVQGAAPVLGETAAPPVTVDVGFLLAQPDSPV